LNFLKLIFKDKEYIALAYMTGILPIKKYGTHSALNMFYEYSMISPMMMSRYVGFVQSEVDRLCQMYDMDVNEMRTWYDGYEFRNEPSVYCPQSVVMALLSEIYENYWTQTETYEALKIYIDINYDGLREAIISLLAGERKVINTTKYTNDMVTFTS
jgi:hypothetical protein